jgi:hypothetical protein
VDDVGDLIKELAATPGPDSQGVLDRADELLTKVAEEEAPKGQDRMVINKSDTNDSTSTTPGGGDGPPSGAAGGLGLSQSGAEGGPINVDFTDGTDGMAPEQASFLKTLEQDAEERAQRRAVKTAQSQAIKAKGNTAFAAGDYIAAIGLYMDAIKLDPSNARCASSTEIYTEDAR